MILSMIPWKWFGIAIAASLAFYGLTQHYYNKGKLAERASWESRIASETAKNAALTTNIAKSTEELNKKLEVKTIIRTQKEAIYVDRIKTLVKTIPADCVIDPKLVEAQNALKGEFK